MRRPRLARRQLVLACVALLATVGSLAGIASLRHSRNALPQPVGSYAALAGSSGPAAFGHRTACGGVIGPDTVGVGQPTLPCGMKVFVTFHGTSVLTRVIDRGPKEPGRQFDLTDALARELGLSGVQVVHWSYAGAG